MTTTTYPSVRCSYCTKGVVHGHGSKPDRRCLACGGTGELPAPRCPICDEPLLDHETRVFSVGGKLVHPSGRAAHLSCLPLSKPEPYPRCLACGGTGTVPAGWVTATERACPCLDLTEEDV
jgi:hypothetical protein